MRLWKLGIIAVIVLGGALVLSLGAQEASTAKNSPAATNTPVGDEIAWQKYDDGLKLASQSNRPILVDFYTNWCGWCKKMDKTTYADPTVVEYMKTKFVAVKVNAESREAIELPSGKIDGRMLARSFGVTGYPSIWFLESDGKKINNLPGFVPPERFIHVLRYIGDGVYKSQSFKDYYAKATASD
jgi:thioredoxin-related protein